MHLNLNYIFCSLIFGIFCEVTMSHLLLQLIIFSALNATEVIHESYYSYVILSKSLIFTTVCHSSQNCLNKSRKSSLSLLFPGWHNSFMLIVRSRRTSYMIYERNRSGRRLFTLRIFFWRNKKYFQQDFINANKWIKFILIS